MNVRNLSRQLSEIDQRRLYRQEVTARTAAARMEAWAKANKRWKDHTGHAVGGLRGRSARSGAVITITLSGSVRYMVYLELAHKKKYAILWPALQRHQSEILNAMARIGGMRE